MQKPGDVWMLPLVAVMTIIVALPVKTYAFLTMNTHGWLTRRADLIGGEAQSAASLR
jgi:hyaluronan synthase